MEARFNGYGARSTILRLDLSGSAWAYLGRALPGIKMASKGNKIKRWTEEETEIFERGVAKYGWGCWSKIAASSRSLRRTSNQVKSFAQKYKVRNRKTKSNLFLKRHNKDQAPARPKKRLKRLRLESASRRSNREAPNLPASPKTSIMKSTATPAPPSPSCDRDSSPPNAFSSPAILGPTTSLVPAKFSRRSTAFVMTNGEGKANTPSPSSVKNSKSCDIKSDSVADALASTPTKNDLPAESTQPLAESSQPPHAFLRVNIEPSFDELKKTTVVSPPSSTRNTEKDSGINFFERVSLEEEDHSFIAGDSKFSGLFNDVSSRSLEKIDVSSSDPMFDLEVMFGNSTLSREDAPGDGSTSPVNLEQESLAWDPLPLASSHAVVTEEDIEGVSTAEFLKDARDFIKADVDYNNPNECTIHEDGLTRSPLDKPALERYRIKNVLESHLKEEWWFEAESKAGDVADVEMPRENQLERLISLTAVMVESSEWHRASCARDKMEVFLVGSRLVELWGLVLNFMTLDSDAKARIPAVKNMSARIDWLCRCRCLDTQAEP